MVRRAYPEHLCGRRIRGPFADAVMDAYGALLGLVFSPVSLCFCMLPEADADWRVVMP